MHAHAARALRVYVPVPPGSVHVGGCAAAKSAVRFALAVVRLAFAAERSALDFERSALADIRRAFADKRFALVAVRLAALDWQADSATDTPLRVGDGGCGLGGGGFGGRGLGGGGFGG